MNKIFAFILIFCFGYSKFHCQVAIGKPSTGVNSSVVLDLTNSDNRGLLLPFSNTISSPEGNIFYNNNHKMISLIDTVGENLLSPWKYYSNSLGAVTFGLDSSVNIGVGITAPSVKFHLKGNTAAKGNNSGGAFQIGLGGEQHIVMDSTRIISKSNNNTESILKLQDLNGHVEIGNHYSSNIENTASNLNGPVPSGGIIMWSGSVNDIPDGWLLCDGRPRTATENTPNLSGRFIVGIGRSAPSPSHNYQLGEKSGSDNISLTISNMPNHDHGGSTGNDGGHHHIYRDRFYIEHDDQSDMQRDPQEYTDGWNRDFVVDLDGSSWAANNGGGEGGVGSEGTDRDNDAYLYTYDKTISKSSISSSSTENFRNGQTMNNVNDNSAHTHSINSQGSGTAFSNRPKYYALCFIMKK